MTYDDQSLQGLNDITPRTSSSPLDVEHIRSRVDELSAALTFYRVQTVKDLLDLTYLQRLSCSPDERSSVESAPETSTDVQVDLNSLYSEIDDVVTMTVRQEHGQPIEKSLQAMIGLRNKQDHTSTTKVCGKTIPHLRPLLMDFPGSYRITVAHTAHAASRG